MYAKWYPNYDSIFSTKDYSVEGSRLGRNWYGPDGMWERPEIYWEDEWTLRITSFDKIGSRRIAWDGSKTRLRKHYKSREEVNADWLWIKKTQPDYSRLEAAGFEKL